MDEELKGEYRWKTDEDERLQNEDGEEGRTEAVIKGEVIKRNGILGGPEEDFVTRAEWNEGEIGKMEREVKEAQEREGMLVISGGSVRQG